MPKAIKSLNGHSLNSQKKTGECRSRFTGRKEEVANRVSAVGRILSLIEPLPDEWVADAEEYKRKKAEEKAGSMGPMGAMVSHDLLKKISEQISERYHTPDGQAVVCIAHEDHDEHLMVRGKPLAQWVKKEFFRLTDGRVLPSQTLQDYLGVIEGQCLHDGEEHALSVRTAEANNIIYIDLANEAHEVVKITAKDWSIVSNQNLPVRFWKPKGMLALPTPKRGGNIKQLRQFVNIRNEQWPLLPGCLVAFIRPRGPYPAVQLDAQQGDGKTAATRAIKASIDPNVAPVRSVPNDARELVISAMNSHLLAYDNLSYLNWKMSDQFCRLLFGVGFGTRELYTNSDEMTFSGARPMILNGIETTGTRPDLLDRSVLINLPPIKSSQRLPERVFWEKFEEARPYITGALYSAVSCAIRRLPEVEKLDWDFPRMKDFAQWATAAEPALGLKDGEFLRAYQANQLEAHELALDGAVIVPAIKSLVKRYPVIKGKVAVWTTAKLLKELRKGHEEEAKRHGWPKSANQLSGMIHRIAPNLKAIGIDAQQISHGRGDEKRKVWKLTTIKPAPHKKV